MLALEDSHWADASTITLFLELARVLREDRVALYLTARAGVGRLVDEMAGTDPQVALRLRLEPLDAHGIAALTASLLDGTPPSGLLPVLFDRGAGNPFFVEETVRSLLDTGVLIHTSGRWELGRGWDESEVAPTIEGVLAARIDAMPTRTGRLLGVASVIGRRVRLGLLRAVLPDASDLDTSLGQLLGWFPRRGDRPARGGGRLPPCADAGSGIWPPLRRRRRDSTFGWPRPPTPVGAGDDVIDLVARHLYLGEAGSRASTT